MLPYFYHSELVDTTKHYTLPEDTSKHMVQVLRMQAGAHLHLTNGNGLKALAEIDTAHKKHCTVSIHEFNQEPAPLRNNTIAIALLKNASRLEWFLEKATELGIRCIVPLLTARTEKQHAKQDRLQQIVLSAMLQSQQTYLPQLLSPIKFSEFLQTEPAGNKLIAHCMEGEKRPLSSSISVQSTLLIGPEGDFTEAELSAALAKGYEPVSLGNTRLRTETAGVVAATLLQLSNPAL